MIMAVLIFSVILQTVISAVMLSIGGQWAMSKTKPCQFSSVTSLCTHLYMS